MKRRSFLHSSAALGLLGLAGCATSSLPARAKVVVIGGGFGGATAAKYVRLLSDSKVDVVLVEPDPAFVSCPVSNLVIGGSRHLADITVPYTGLERRHGVRIARDWAQSVDTRRKTVTLAGGATLAYDMLVVAPGIELQLDAIEGLRAAREAGRIVQAWKAGPETVALRRQLEAMPDGGVFAIAIPEEPYRCPPAPYERACQAAWYFQRAKPRSKVLILDANPDVTSKGPLFKKVWAEEYRGMVEYRPQYKTVAVDARAGVLKFEVQDDVKADVLNVLPPMRAGTIAQQAGLNDQANHRWCGVDFLTFESTVARDVYVLGDAIQIAPLMAKSGHMANNHAKVAAAAIVARLAGWPVNPSPMLTNTCYSYLDDTSVVHVSSVHAYDAAQKTFLPVPGAGGLSPAPSREEALDAWNWAHNIWADCVA
ncbi:MAG: FAD-dependent oxidoreductase [Burkholderiales bacterium]|nr:FAD-dependent oxidoreductase [Burkholderiales bacterium]